MNDLLNFRLHLRFLHSNLAQVLLSIVLVFAVGQIGLAQISQPQFECQEGVPTFEGLPKQTLCEKYSNFNCTIEIGNGTQFPKSMSGNFIC
jgi:hypothetical protein